MHMNVLRHLFTSMAFVMTFIAQAVNPYPQLEAKANRFFDHKEWASASAMFDLMLEEKPEVASTYGQAIVSNAMRGDTVAQMRLMHGALDNHIPFDSVFSQVKQWSFHLGKSHLYENFLKQMRQAYPWMRRTIDGNLLRYYAFRRNGKEMIEYSKIMLDGAPDNKEFLQALAQGYMLTGNDSCGVEVYERILKLHPHDFSALVALGNWHAAQTADTSSQVKAMGYLREAYSVKPTPFVWETMRRITAELSAK